MGRIVHQLSKKPSTYPASSGCFGRPVSSPFSKNISLVPSGKSEALSRASRAERGALANVINAARDAVDAEALLDEQRGCVRRSRVVLTPRRWRQVRGSHSAGEGGKQARSPGRARYKP